MSVEAGPGGAHARHRLEEILASPVRFSIAAALASVDEAEFGHIRDRLELTDSTLSKQAAALERAGLVRVRKGYVGRRPRTWLSLTRDGRRAWDRHLAALREISGS